MDKYLKSALSQVQAEKRAALFTNDRDNINYNLFLKLKKGETYDGVLTILFQLKSVSSDLFLDYAGTQVHELFINGTKIDTNDNYESIRDRRFLKLAEDKIRTGKNEVIIRFSNLYSNDGLGLHSFTDTD